MSLYNMLFGVNPSAGVLLGMLGTDIGGVPRFRDCYLSGDNIVIHTRTGGGNRDYYDSLESRLDEYPESEYDGPFNADLRTLPNYLRDRDDDFDSTYADFYFSIPEKFKAEVEILRDMGGERDPGQAWQDLFTKLHSGDKDDPDVQRVLTAAAPIIEKLAEFAKQGQ